MARISSDCEGTIELEGKVLRPVLDITYLQLEVLEGPDAGRIFVQYNDVVRIGSDPHCHVELSDPTVSRFHCDLSNDPEGLLLSDAGSTNGTYLGKMKVERVFLPPLSTLSLGNTSIRVTTGVDQVVAEPAKETHLGELVGPSVLMREVFHLLKKAAVTELTVVLEGETGTGKELAARATHNLSHRRSRPMVVFDCAAVPRDLAESELFGHQRGAFSGAISNHKGVFERANGSTLFFDELGQLDPVLQPKLLRALETGIIRPVGSEHEIRVDVRVVAATNRPLKEFVESGGFRKDLYYRLAKLVIAIPPLRKRPEDVPVLAQHFLDQATAPGTYSISPRAMEILCVYSWPGNVRELRNLVEGRIPFLDGNEIGMEDLPLDHRNTPSEFQSFRQAKQEVLDTFERRYLESLLERSRNNISQAARLAGLDRRHFYRLLHKHGLG